GIKPPPITGRFGTPLKIDIGGLLNVGKSTFFDVLTSSQASAENFPFGTIAPNESRVPVPDERFDFLCQYHKPASKIPAFLNVVDIAGLVKGAHDGQGAFEDGDITYVEGSVDPIEDTEIIHEELQLKEEEMIGKLDKLEKVSVRGGDKKLKPLWEAEVGGSRGQEFKTSLVNMEGRKEGRKEIKEWVDKCDPGAFVTHFSGALARIESNTTQSALPKIIKAGFAALQLEYIFTAGPDEVRAWTIRKGTKDPQAAGKIHTDFEKGFIVAEVMKYEDFKWEGSEDAVKAAGKYRQQSRNYIVEDGYMIFFKFNTPQQPKKTDNACFTVLQTSTLNKTFGEKNKQTNSWAQAILLPRPPKVLGLQA
uniref:TGS domain-containing protein n=1 Tax=Colobus angolensis palliatus TaxID=336983 RepID=A0A2K5I6T6_COLAP